MLRHSCATLVFVCAAATAVYADPFVITSGSFGLGRGLIGTAASAASLLWLDPPPGVWDSPARQGVTSMDAAWSPGEYASNLPGTNAPVGPLSPGSVPAGGTFMSTHEASFYFFNPDYGSPSLDSEIALEFSGGAFTVPSVFPPVDDEGLYILRRPFTMHGTWTVNENGRTLFHGDLAGRGRASLVLQADVSTGQSKISGVDYEFLPTPEPSTLTLLAAAGGITGLRRARALAGRARRFRSRT